MATLTDLINSQKTQPPPLGGMWYAQIVAPLPTDDTKPLSIVIPDIDPQTRWDNVRYDRSEFRNLAVGKEALVAFDNRQNLWLVSHRLNNLLIKDADVAPAANIDSTKIATTYTSYIPTLSSSGGGASLGNATFGACAYTKIGRFVHMYGTINWGSTSNAGSGYWIIGLPLVNNGGNVSGNGYVYDTSAANFVPTVCQIQGTGLITYQNGTSYLIGAGQPWVWASGDQINYNLMFQN